MRYGFCTGFATEPLFAIDSGLETDAAGWGFDFIEYPLMSVAALSDGDFTALIRRREASGLSCDCAANLFPASVPVIGADVSERRMRDYLDKALSRASASGITKLIFGSAGARKLGDYDRKASDGQFLACLGVLEEYCRHYGMSVLIEAIRHGEADYVNTLDEAAAFVRTARRNGMERIGLMADLFHMMSNGEPLSSLRGNLELIDHIHICEPDRQLPGDTFSPYLAEALRILKVNGYDSTVSYESVRPCSPEEGKRVLKLLKDSMPDPAA